MNRIPQSRVKCENKTNFLNLEKMRNLGFSFRLKNHVKRVTLRRSLLLDICS